MSRLKRRYLCCQDHTDPVPGLQKPLQKRPLVTTECRLALVAGMNWRNERVGAMLENIDWETFSENICCCVEVAENCVAPPPFYRADGVWVHRIHEEIHASPPARRECTLMYASLNPIDRPADWTTIMMAAMMSSPWICWQLVPFL